MEGQQPPSGGPGGGSGGAGGLFNIGTAGPLRLFTQPLAEQIVWLLPLAIFGAIALAWQRKPRFQRDRQQQSLLLWGTWLLTMGIFFSVAGFFHQYYMTVMAPAIAALFGIGLVMMWRDYRRGGWRGWLLPLALAATVVEQVYIVSNYPAWGRWMIPVMIGLGALAVGGLVVARIIPRFNVRVFKAGFLVPVVGIGVMAIMLAPAVWGAIPVIEGTSTDLLTAGPSTVTTSSFGGSGAASQSSSPNSKLISYLEASQGNAKYLVAVSSSHTADDLILATNKPVMTLGGFSGSDPILTTSQLAALASKGTVRYFLLSSNDQSTLAIWVKQHSMVVATSLWESTSTSSHAGPNQDYQLYVYSSTK
jgi:4-amino-4-deoxy-L-arabinose transferase-like glycosyltransferase